MKEKPIKEELLAEVKVEKVEKKRRAPKKVERKQEPKAAPVISS